jgi:general secretion pathway protein A
VLRSVIATLRAAERRHLLIVDEAQGLTAPALEELRMLSNITDGGRALLQTMLLGQPQLRRTMASPDLDQLRQRVLASYHLGGLSAEETAAYVEHRMRAVGWDGRPAWEMPALELVYRHSGGIPRRINRLCSRILLSAALEEAETLTGPMVEAVALELEEDLGGDAMALTPAARFDLGAVIDDLGQRVDALEQTVAKRERVLARMSELFGGEGRR